MDEEFDHLKFSYNGKDIFIPEGHLTSWKSTESDLTVERTSYNNSILVTLPDIAEISVNVDYVVPSTREGDRIHNYCMPSNSCFAHLELQLKFYSSSSKVEGVLGRTYQPDFVNPTKPGVAMPIIGGEDFTSRYGLLFMYILSSRGSKGFISDGLWHSRLHRCSV